MRRRSEQLHEIVFYKDRNGNEPVYEYMSELARSNSKDSRVKLKKDPGIYQGSLREWDTAAGKLCEAP